DEMRFHVDKEAADLERRGLAPDEARRRALANFGGVSRFKEESRGAGKLDELRRNLRYGVRSLLRSPGYAAVVAGTPSLGGAANASIFSVANGILLKPLPWRDPEKLLLIWDNLDFWGATEALVTGPEVGRLRAETTRFDGFAAMRPNSVNIGGSNGADP